MDSIVINKLIRSEIWPILRKQGFSQFDSRNARAYSSPFINVVNFQSFNSYNAEILKCTTFSFIVNMGVYVVGMPGASLIDRDKSGSLLPTEPHCAFRRSLKKRTLVDGFANREIFYIHPDGRTTSKVFEEVKSLLIEELPKWFQAHNDLEQLLASMQSAAMPTASEEERTTFSCIARPGAYYWNLLESTLRLLKHQKSPSPASAEVAVEAINRTIGTVLDYSTIMCGRPNEERHAIDIRELWDQLGDFKPEPAFVGSENNRDVTLIGQAWSPTTPSAVEKGNSEAQSESSLARKYLWPTLKAVGFSEFTDRIAHRDSDRLVEVVEFLPVDPYETRHSKLPTGLFRIGLGVFWPDLARDGFFRKNRAGNPRPITNECHVSNWLIPSRRIWETAWTAFDSSDDAMKNLRDDGLRWLDNLRNDESALSLLGRENWELFWRYPMMRGYGARESRLRLVYSSCLNHRLGNSTASKEEIRRAETIPGPSHLEHAAYEYRAWIAKLKAKMSTDS